MAQLAHAAKPHINPIKKAIYTAKAHIRDTKGGLSVTKLAHSTTIRSLFVFSCWSLLQTLGGRSARQFSNSLPKPMALIRYMGRLKRSATRGTDSFSGLGISPHSWVWEYPKTRQGFL